MQNLAQLRAYATRRTFFASADLADTIRRIGFVQADPIRAPARAQDLILRQRMPDYRAGDLERHYATLPVVEDMLHVYGFMTRARLALLHPRDVQKSWRVEREFPHLREPLLEHIAANGPSHPRAIEQAFQLAATPVQSSTIVNPWGGKSSATTRMLEALHYRGHLQVARRATGIKVYTLAQPVPPLPPAARAAGLVRLLAGLYAPLSRSTMSQLLNMLDVAEADPRAALERLLASGEIREQKLDGVAYLWPAHEQPHDEAEERVRLLAPFDPVVWDRRRFKHLWGWDYRFEAYTPAAARRFGYYALPLLWREHVIGWANVTAGGKDVDIGYVNGAPGDARFHNALEQEIAALRRFLGTPGNIQSVDGAMEGSTQSTAENAPATQTA